MDGLWKWLNKKLVMVVSRNLLHTGDCIIWRLKICLKNWLPSSNMLGKGSFLRAILRRKQRISQEFIHTSIMFVLNIHIKLILIIIRSGNILRIVKNIKIPFCWWHWFINYIRAIHHRLTKFVIASFRYIWFIKEIRSINIVCRIFFTWVILFIWIQTIITNWAVRYIQWFAWRTLHTRLLSLVFASVETF